MSGISKISEIMKKKIALEDYNNLAAHSSEEKKEKGGDRKIYTISEEDASMLQKIFLNRVSTSSEISIAQIMSEAIHLLYKQEF